MSTINFGTTVSLAEAATLVRTCQDNVFFLRGEPGIGKSSIMAAFEQHFGDAYAYAFRAALFVTASLFVNAVVDLLEYTRSADRPAG